jgi:predicted restriction endonuclease
VYLIQHLLHPGMKLTRAPISLQVASTPRGLIKMAVPQSFPAKIYQILENESPEIIQWNENGQSFRIMDHGRFEREIVPKYFRRKVFCGDEVSERS